MAIARGDMHVICGRQKDTQAMNDSAQTTAINVYNATVIADSGTVGNFCVSLVCDNSVRLADLRHAARAPLPSKSYHRPCVSLPHTAFARATNAFYHTYFVTSNMRATRRTCIRLVVR